MIVVISCFRRMLNRLILFPCIEAGAGLSHFRQVAVSAYTGVKIEASQSFQQAQERCLLLWRACVCGVAVRVQAALVANAQRVTVDSFGVRADEVEVTRLCYLTVARDVEVIAGKAEALLVAPYECRDRKRLVAACGTAVYYYKVYFSHDRNCYLNPLLTYSSAQRKSL